MSHRRQHGQWTWATRRCSVTGQDHELFGGLHLASRHPRHRGAHLLFGVHADRVLQLFYLSIVFYNASLLAVKITFLLQYHRVFTVRSMRRIFICALVLIGSWCLSQLLVAVFNCWPIAGFWDPTVKARCIPNLPFWYINAAGNIATDIAIFVLPLPVIGSLKLAKGQKLVLVGIFSLGFL